jgi:hypothetical protein
MENPVSLLVSASKFDWRAAAGLCRDESFAGKDFAALGRLYPYLGFRASVADRIALDLEMRKAAGLLLASQIPQKAAGGLG